MSSIPQPYTASPAFNTANKAWAAGLGFTLASQRGTSIPSSTRGSTPLSSWSAMTVMTCVGADPRSGKRFKSPKEGEPSYLFDRWPSAGVSCPANNAAWDGRTKRTPDQNMQNESE